MNTIREMSGLILETDRRWRSADAAGDYAGWEAALNEIDRLESAIAKLRADEFFDTIIMQIILVGRIRRLRQDIGRAAEGGMEHDAERIAAEVLRFLLEENSSESDHLRDLIEYAYRWSPLTTPLSTA